MTEEKENLYKWLSVAALAVGLFIGMCLGAYIQHKVGFYTI